MSKLKPAAKERYVAPAANFVFSRTTDVLCASVQGSALPEGQYDDTGLEF